jgi:ATP-binding cassette subfamily B protein
MVVVFATALLVAAGAVLALGQGLRLVIDRGLTSGDPRLLDQALIAILAGVIVLAAATFVRFTTVSWIGDRVATDIRKAVFDRLLELSPAYYDQARTGEAVTRLTADTGVLELVIGSSFSLALRNSVLLAGGLTLMAITSPKLTLLVAIGVPLCVGPIVLFGRRVRRLSRLTQDRVAAVGAHIDEALHGIRTIQAFTYEDEERQQFGQRVEAQFSAAIGRARQRGLLIALVMLLGFGSIGAILWIGGQDVLSGKLSAGDLSAFVFYAAVVAAAFGTIAEVYGDLQRAAGATERLFQVLQHQPTIAPPAAPRHLPARARGEIRFDGVSFAYPTRAGINALEDFFLHITAGENLAVVGPSGAGKSTVLQLLLRFYDPQRGQISIDGVSIADLEPRELRRQIAWVPQDPTIFAASLRDNLLLARPQATESELLTACAAAQALEFIERLEHGLDTELGERGVRLSGGQRQRLAIARAVLADRPILLLDEATSALDAESERLVQLALQDLMVGRTSVVIAHRLATVQRAQRIAVLEAGRVSSTGSHAQLVAQGGLYAHLAALQFNPAHWPLRAANF